jgi:hypothetical protein
LTLVFGHARLSFLRYAAPVASSSRFAKTVEEVIRRAVHPQLTLLGFKRSRNHFRRTVGRCVQGISFQTSAFQTFDARFTINLGVDFPEARKISVGLYPSSGPGLLGMHGAGTRIGTLMPDGCDHWWEVVPVGPTDPLDAIGRGWGPERALPMDTVVAEVRDAVLNLALPWLEKFSDPREALKRSMGPGATRAMVLALMLGDLEEAKRQAREHMRTWPDDELVHDWANEHELLK